MGVQVGVSGARVAVGECGCDEAGDVDLADPMGGAGTGEGRLPFEPAHRVGDRALVGLLDLGGDLRWGDRPQGRHALDRRERPVSYTHLTLPTNREV